MNLSGKRAIVTGAGSGIGAAIAARLAADGARVVVSDVKEIKGLSCPADVSSEEQVSRLVGFAVRELGGLDAMINNAGIGEADAPLDEKSTADWNRVISINLTGAFFGVKHAARAMKKAGRGGVIVNMSWWPTSCRTRPAS